LKVQTNVAVMTPQYLSKLIMDNDIDPSKLRVSKPMKATWTSFSMMTQRSGKILELGAGLEFSDSSHVYTLYLPLNDPRKYVHLAGGAGRVGQMGLVWGGGGRVVSILSKEEAEKMQDMAREVKFDFVNIEPLSDSFSGDTDGVFDVDRENMEEL
jgi:superfamily II DNA/RNA helicase